MPDSLITDAILSRGLGLDEAKKEVAELVAWLKSLGNGRIDFDIAEKEYKLDLIWKFK